jgi:hypothetical protein
MRTVKTVAFETGVPVSKIGLDLDLLVEEQLSKYNELCIEVCKRILAHVSVGFLKVFEKIQDFVLN